MLMVLIYAIHEPLLSSECEYEVFGLSYRKCLAVHTVSLVVCLFIRCLGCRAKHLLVTCRRCVTNVASLRNTILSLTKEQCTNLCLFSKSPRESTLALEKVWCLNGQWILALLTNVNFLNFLSQNLVIHDLSLLFWLLCCFRLKVLCDYLFCGLWSYSGFLKKVKSNYFIVCPKVYQIARQLSLPHLGI